MYRVLIVDQDRDTCESLKFMLEWSDYNVSGIQSARSLTEALSKAVDYRPHIVLISTELPPGSGFAAAEHFRSMGLDAVCCLMSPRADFREIQQAMEVGARGFLLKPIDRKALGEFVERAIVWELHGELAKKPVLREIDPVLKVDYSGFSNITNKLILMVKADYRSSLTLIGIAEALNMSSKYMGRVFLQDTGIKFSDYLMAYRMLQARRLIESTQEKISVIASMVGYSQINNFYVHFKRYCGHSPSELRSFENK